MGLYFGKYTHGPSYNAVRKWARSIDESCKNTTSSSPASLSPLSPAWSVFHIDPRVSLFGWGRENISRKHTECRESWDMWTRNSVFSARSTMEPSLNHRSGWRWSGVEVSMTLAEAGPSTGELGLESSVGVCRACFVPSRRVERETDPSPKRLECELPLRL